MNALRQITTLLTVAVIAAVSFTGGPPWGRPQARIAPYITG